MAKSKRQLEAKLDAQKKKAALLIVENDLAENGESKSQEELAQEIGVSRNTLYRWRTQDDDFRDYVNLIADDFFRAHQTEVYRQHMKLIKGTQPSVKAIDLWYRRWGMLTDRTITEDTAGNANSNEDIAKETAELDALLNEEE